MKTLNVEEKIVIPQGVTVNVNGFNLSVTGPKGTVERVLYDPQLKLIVEGQTIVIKSEVMTQREKKLSKTFIAHINNLFKGVTEGHVYKLKICSGHFPMNVSLKNNMLEVKNFIGEAVPRRLQFKEGVDVKLANPEITITGINKEKVSQAAASIEQLMRRPGFDRRIFQDGIYIVSKDGKKL